MRRELALLSLVLLIGCRPSAGEAAPSPNPPGEVHLGKASRDPDAELALQVEVDQGHMPWRLDSLEVARVDGQELGFTAGDGFAPGPAPAAMATREAVVRVVHAGRPYEIRLIQPIRTGPDAIWVIDEVRAG
jgi:hypothetical protein